MMSSTVAVFGQVHGLGNRAAEERLRGGHHPDVAAVVQRALAVVRLERAVEDRQCSGFRPLRMTAPVPSSVDVLDGVVTCRCAR